MCLSNTVCVAENTLLCKKCTLLCYSLFILTQILCCPCINTHICFKSVGVELLKCSRVQLKQLLAGLGANWCAFGAHNQPNPTTSITSGDILSDVLDWGSWKAARCCSKGVQTANWACCVFLNMESPTIMTSLLFASWPALFIGSWMLFLSFSWCWFWSSKCWSGSNLLDVWISGGCVWRNFFFSLLLPIWTQLFRLWIHVETCLFYFYPHSESLE